MEKYEDAMKIVCQAIADSKDNAGGLYDTWRFLLSWTISHECNLSVGSANKASTSFLDAMIEDFIMN